MGFLASAGLAAIGIGGNLVGSVIGSRLGRGDFEHRLRTLRKLGLTPQEIAGGGGAGGAGAFGSYQSIGNAGGQAQQAVQFHQSQALELTKAELSAKTAVEVAKISSGPAGGRLDFDREVYQAFGMTKGELQNRLLGHQVRGAAAGVRKTQQEVRKLWVETEQAKVQLAFDRWLKTPEVTLLLKSMGMSVGNMVATAEMLRIAREKNIDIWSGKASARDYGEIAQAMLALDSKAYRESVGAAKAQTDGISVVPNIKTGQWDRAAIDAAKTVADRMVKSGSWSQREIGVLGKGLKLVLDHLRRNGR